MRLRKEAHNFDSIFTELLLPTSSGITALLCRTPRPQLPPVSSGPQTARSSEKPPPRTARAPQGAVGAEQGGLAGRSRVPGRLGLPGTPASPASRSSASSTPPRPPSPRPPSPRPGGELTGLHPPPGSQALGPADLPTFSLEVDSRAIGRRPSKRLKPQTVRDVPDTTGACGEPQRGGRRAR